ncbi:NAD(P)H-hydrate dehydratase [Patescibacteria group bacterium]|nr:NAD(P)H-hydrate dehydratase [Patescibacteria group bacterium]
MRTLPPHLHSFFQQLRIPQSDSHKGQNGKLLIVGGSELFHAASRWSLDVASCFVDMVFYSSVPSNNDLIQEAKGQFWNGIVVKREEVEEYAKEADCILIGPGMTRSEDTTQVTEQLVAKFSDKKWVIDAGALQMISPQLLNKNMIITPHLRELAMLLAKIEGQDEASVQEKLLTASDTDLQVWCQKLNGVTLLLKGKVDRVCTVDQVISIEGGDPGMTKGGTGDVLAGLVAALACTNDLLTASVVGSIVNKRAGEVLAEKYGSFFNASMLITAVPEALWQLRTGKASENPS